MLWLIGVSSGALYGKFKSFYSKFCSKKNLKNLLKKNCWLSLLSGLYWFFFHFPLWHHKAIHNSWNQPVNQFRSIDLLFVTGRAMFSNPPRYHPGVSGWSWCTTVTFCLLMASNDHRTICWPQSIHPERGLEAHVQVREGRDAPNRYMHVSKSRCTCSIFNATAGQAWLTEMK